MADDDAPTTSFDDIELHKENIVPISSGRSARALAASLSPLALNPTAARSEHHARQVEFENQLKTADDLDDPLDLWIQYIQWTMNTFTAGNSRESNLVPLLERCTRAFVRDTRYQNDPRYLRLWIQYARDFSDAPREVFAYLARNDIGQKLALFYEEYAALLENFGRRTQAEEMYLMGIDNGASPADRLARKFDEFRRRMEANPPTGNDPQSPALPKVRPALATRSVMGAPGDAESNPQQQQTQAQKAAKPAKQKMAIFSDADGIESAKASKGPATGGWDSIGSLQHRKKENAHEPRPWAGETLKQKGTSKPAGEKLAVFRDTSRQDLPVSTNVATNKRPERLAVQWELLYPEGDGEDQEEYSFDELRAISRGLYGIDWNMERQAENDKLRGYSQQNTKSVGDSKTPVKVKTVLSPSPNKGKIKRKSKGSSFNSEPTMTFHTKAATDEIYDLFNKPLDKPANDPYADEDSASDSEDDRSEGDYTTFTQIAPSEQEESDNDDESQVPDPDLSDDGDSVHSSWSDFTFHKKEVTTEEVTEVAPPPKMEKLSIFSDEQPPRAVPANPPPGRKLQIPPPPEDYDPPRLPYHMAKDQSHLQSRLPFMTPIVEKTESLPPTTIRASVARTPLRAKGPALRDFENALDEVDETEELPAMKPMAQLVMKDSAPAPPRVPLVPKAALKVTAPAVVKPVVEDLLCNPQDLVLRSTILSRLDPPLKSYEGYYEKTYKKFGMSSEIKKFGKASKSGSEKTMSSVRPPQIEFVTGDGGCFYTVLKELGKGAFAPVYMVENNIFADAEDEAEEDGELILDSRLAGRHRHEAMKMEHPPNAWEFYIMRAAENRLKNTRALDSLVKAHEMHLFADEGYLFIDYRDQGTILDVVNSNRADPANTSGAGLDECLAMFLVIESLRTMEGLHSHGIIHGDIKADNVLVRCDLIPDVEWDPYYRPDGTGGWNKKGLSFIDFGRGIDMKLFPPGVQFIADWKTDNQDCAEMREMRPWTYQVDYHGLAAIAHLLLFGKYIETTTERAQSIGGMSRHRVSASLKRYWQQDIWKDFFDVMLNPLLHTEKERGGSMPILVKMKELRRRMEQWVEANAEKGAGLKALVKKKLEIRGVGNKRR